MRFLQEGRNLSQFDHQTSSEIHTCSCQEQKTTMCPTTNYCIVSLKCLFKSSLEMTAHNENFSYSEIHQKLPQLSQEFQNREGWQKKKWPIAGESHWSSENTYPNYTHTRTHACMHTRKHRHNVFTDIYMADVNYSQINIHVPIQLGKKIKTFNFFNFILCAWVFCLHECMCTVCMPGAIGGWKKVHISWSWSYSCNIDVRN